MYLYLYPLPLKVSGLIYRLNRGSPQRRSGMDYTAYLQITPCVPLPRKRSPDGATNDCSGRHLIAIYYSFIDPERMKG